MNHGLPTKPRYHLDRRLIAAYTMSIHRARAEYARAPITTPDFRCVRGCGVSVDWEHAVCEWCGGEADVQHAS